MKTIFYKKSDNNNLQQNSKSITMPKFRLLLLCILFCLPAHYAYSQNPSAQEIMEMVDNRDDGDRSVADMQMLLIDRNSNQRIRTLRSFGIDQKEDRYSLMFFLSPAEVKGTGFLSYDYDAEGKDDDQWLYLPALKKVKRIASNDKSGSFMGSDFSYADLTKRRLKDYNYSFYMKQPQVTVYGEPCWVIESVPKNENIVDEIGYIKSIIFVRQDIKVVVRAINYLEDSSDIKYFDVKKMKIIDGIWTGLEIHMTRKKGNKIIHKTILTQENIRYNQELVNDALFSTRNLEKGL
ncbi:MAG: outer membrane lipoprotein-sorting protein [Desulfobulbaceae bacterium]|nr:outer membrane lipoprotein-sorting protein [Desulfobulbaceae bacterium]